MSSTVEGKVVLERKKLKVDKGTALLLRQEGTHGSGWPWESLEHDRKEQ